MEIAWRQIAGKGGRYDAAGMLQAAAGAGVGSELVVRIGKVVLRYTFRSEPHKRLYHAPCPAELDTRLPSRHPTSPEPPQYALGSGHREAPT